MIIAVYVDDLNIIGTPEELQKAENCLKLEFEMNDLGRTRFCLGLQIEHLKDGIFMHQSTYISKILKRFYMDKAHPLSTPMVVRSLETIKDHFRPKENNEEFVGPLSQPDLFWQIRTESEMPCYHSIIQNPIFAEAISKFGQTHKHLHLTKYIYHEDIQAFSK